MPVCLLGGTGSGKTSLIKEFISQGLSADEWELGQLVLSATTPASLIQSYIESKLEKQRKGVFGPSVQGKRLLFFFDDLGMPAREKYGAQPPLELLRTLMDDGGLYDLKDTFRKEVVGTVMVAAMGLPSGGRSLPSNRLLRHFSLVGLPELSSEMMLHVFSKVLQDGISGYEPVWTEVGPTLIQLSVSLYQRVRETLLPTPSKSHYQFNVRQPVSYTHLTLPTILRV